MPAAPRKTADHRSPKADTVDELDEYFSFKVDDDRYICPRKTAEVLTPGWVRANRRRDEVDYMMTLMEQLCSDYDGAKRELTDDEREVGEEILKVFDNLDWKTHQKLQGELGKHIGATLGE